MKIPGITVKKGEHYLIAEISELSDELKTIIRERFTSICHGDQCSLLNAGNYTYRRTINEFITRISSKTENTRTGMLGEFVIHVLTGIVYPGYKTIVPYFNLEERNIKKGFDSVIYSADIGIWTYEVKSSRSGKLKSSVASKIKSLIQIAHSDLSKKLKDQDETSRLWSNAMNGLQVACGHLKDEKMILEKIILDHQESAMTPSCSPEQHNVILSAVLMSNAELEISLNCVDERLRDYKETYNNLMIFAVHKSTIVGLLDFLRNEATDEVA